MMIKATVFDLDGTIYEGDNLIEGVSDTLKELEFNGYKVFFCTNNSTKTRQDLAYKLKNLGIVTNHDYIFTSGYIAGHYLSRKGIKEVSIIGIEGLRQELESFRLKVNDRLVLSEALIIGLDKNINYSMMMSIAKLVDKNFQIIACNRDRLFPIENGVLLPGCGVIVDIVESILNRKVDYVVGKPNTLMLEVISEKFGLNNKEILVVGDSIESDIVFAKSFGAPCLQYSPNKEVHKQIEVINKIADIKNKLFNENIRII